MTKTISIVGMSCGHCTARVKAALEALEGVGSADVSLENKCAEVDFDENAVSEAELVDAVEATGFDVVK